MPQPPCEANFTPQVSPGGWQSPYPTNPSSFDGENNPFKTVRETGFVLHRLSVQRGVARETAGHNKEDQVAYMRANCCDQIVLTSLRQQLESSVMSRGTPPEKGYPHIYAG